MTRDGGAIVTEVGVTFGAAESVLERRAEAARLAARGRDARRRGREPAGGRGPAGGGGEATADAVEAARAEESRTESARRAAEEAERLVARRLETVVREASWHEAQAVRLAAELDRARAAVATFDAEIAERDRGRGHAEPGGIGGGDRADGLGGSRRGAAGPPGSPRRGGRRPRRLAPRCREPAGPRRGVHDPGRAADGPRRYRPRDAG